MISIKYRDGKWVFSGEERDKNIAFLLKLKVQQVFSLSPLKNPYCYFLSLTIFSLSYL
jgi:hypothetical protein